MENDRQFSEWLYVCWTMSKCSVKLQDQHFGEKPVVHFSPYIFLIQVITEIQVFR